MKTCQINLVNSYALRPNRINMMKTQKSILGFMTPKTFLDHFVQKNQHRGYTVIEMIIVAAIVFIGGLAMTALYSSQQKNAMRSQIKITKGYLQLTLENILLDQRTGGAIDKIISHNTGLDACINVTASSVCEATTSPTGIKLYDSTDNLVSGESSASPVYYDYQGVKCSAPSALCIFQVYSEYRVSCESSASNCNQPLSVTVKYTIEQVPTVTPLTDIQISAIKPMPVSISRTKHWDHKIKAKITQMSASTSGNHYFCALGSYNGGSCHVSGAGNNWTASGCRANCLDFE